MEDKFSAIFFSQESLDGLMDESRFKAAVLEEFSNGEQILKEAERQGFTFGRFRKEGAVRLSMSFVPERTAKYFYIKKHTSVQRPYTHSHNFYELLYLHGGRCVQFFGDKKIEMGQGELCIISPETVHCIDRCGKGDIILKAVIPKKMYNACADDIMPKIEGVKLFNADRNARFIISKLVSEELAQDRLHEKVVSGYLTLLFAYLCRAAENVESTIEIEAKTYINEHIKDASLQQFAVKLGYSVNYLSRLIKQKTGKNFRELLASIRMELSCGLLSSTDMSVEDIAAEAGYQNTSGFYKQFYVFYGMTPAQYRSATLK